jgi:RHS repeat-associated protein
VDFVQWTGESPPQDTSSWAQINYKQDVAGRRVEKAVDGYSTRYIYDGDSVIAEYDGNNNLLRKYIYGPGIDQPVSMIEVADSNATYYYHFDALGSVVALSNASGDTVQTYEYSVYGEVAVEDANHTNPYMFTGQRFDIETGLYYYRARYYNPYTGRFLQTDRINYGDGMNWYAYCRNNPTNFVDPSGNILLIVPRISIPNIFPPPKLPSSINNLGEAMVWYMYGQGADATMGEAYIDRFKASGAFHDMIKEIEDTGLAFAQVYKIQGGKNWTLSFYWYEVRTVEWPYNPMYNLTFGTIEEVSASVHYQIEWELEYNQEGVLVGVPYLYYTAEFKLRDNFNFEGDNNFLCRFPFCMDKIGTPFNAYGYFSVPGRIRIPISSNAGEKT